MMDKQSYQILMLAEHDEAVGQLENLLVGQCESDFEFTRVSPTEMSSVLIQSSSFDIGLLDLSRCEKADVNTVSKLHRKFPGLPFIVLGDDATSDCALSVLRQGAQDFMLKADINAERLLQSMIYAMERVRCNESQARKVSFEPLTGLANRLLLNDRLQQAINRARRNDTGIAVLYVDVDNFRMVDERLGRDRANQLLKQIADRIRQCLRNTDTVSRVGADEFVVLLEAMNHTHGVVAVSEKILQSITDTFEIEDESVNISCSIGIALYPQCAEDIDDLICKADITRCRAAREGGNRYCIYTEDLDTEFLNAMNLHDDLAHALQRNEFILFFQPKFNLNNGRISGSEALLRWQHPNKGLLLPDQFIHLIEDKDTIKQIGKWILETACETNKRWHENGLCVGPVAVNIAGKQLLDQQFVPLIEEVLEKTALPSCLLELEITEGTLIENVESCNEQLEALRHIGVSIAIDDFGTGYCSFNYLRNFLIDTIKIDRSFIENINNPGPEAAITTAIIRLARDLHVNVVAEGVENLEQFRFLYELAADEIQGNLLSPAMSANSMQNYLITNGLEMNLLLESDLRMAV